VFAVGSDGEERREHRQGDVAIPGLVETDLVVIKTGLVLGELEGSSTPQRDPATRTSSATGTGWGLRQM
jgi:hypothetical protein